MEKTPRYTQRERNMVLTYAAQHKDVIENKRTDAESNRKKDEVWLQIAKDFNSKVYHQRSAKQLRQLYKNMKLLLKKDLCGDDKGNRSFLDLLNTLSQQDSVQQYIAEQMSPDGAGSQTAGCKMADDYEDSKLPLYEGMDTDVILIKSETISDNEHTENGMDCMDDDDDEDCPSPKAPEVCLEEEDEELFPTDRKHLQQHSIGGGGGGGCGNSLPSMNSNHLMNGLNGGNDILPRATSSPVCSTKTSISSTGSYMSGGGGGGTATKPEITLSGVGNIRVGAFASINNTLHNGSSSNNSNNINNNNSSSKNNNNISSSNNNNNNNNNNNAIDRSLHLTDEQVQQHLLLNGLGLSAVHHPPSQSLQAAINAATSGVGSSRQTQTLQLPRLQRGHNSAAAANAAAATAAAAVAAAAASNGTNITTATTAAAAGGNVGGGVQLILNGHHQSRDKTHAQQLHQVGAGITLATGSFNGYNGLGVNNISSINCSASNNNNINSNNNNLNNSSSSSNNNNVSNSNNNNHNNSSSSNGSRGQHNEYMMTLAVEERKRKIELINVQIEYWQTLTKKLDSQSGHYPNPACLCHFPGSNVLGVAAGGVSNNTAATNALQTQSSSS